MYGESIDGSCNNYIPVAPIGLERDATNVKVVGSNPTRDTIRSYIGKERVLQHYQCTMGNGGWASGWELNCLPDTPPASVVPYGSMLG